MPQHPVLPLFSSTFPRALRPLLVKSVLRALRQLHIHDIVQKTPHHVKSRGVKSGDFGGCAVGSPWTIPFPGLLLRKS